MRLIYKTYLFILIAGVNFFSYAQDKEKLFILFRPEIDSIVYLNGQIDFFNIKNDNYEEELLKYKELKKENSFLYPDPVLPEKYFPFKVLYEEKENSINISDFCFIDVSKLRSLPPSRSREFYIIDQSNNKCFKVKFYYNFYQ
ncbi:hypothetical protein [Flavobacterium rhizosphaerae]|uniref:Uncharacterized protein n=1 Tax=Flavobacterium rhizosphaerae TaxID=3163298 RepID=A0ABW8Z022_9FLAO